MELLKQENHELQQKLQLAKQMELAYQDEIDQLKESLRAIQTASSQPIMQPSLDSSCVFALEERADTAEQQVRKLTEELDSVRRKGAQLEERLAAAECLLETSNFSHSISHAGQQLPDASELVEELKCIKDELESQTTKNRVERAQLSRQLIELEEDRDALQSHIQEVEQHLKESRNEYGDVRAQLEALELQNDPAAKSRGNSAFGEVEDRRIRAEQVIQQQRTRLDELESELRQVRAESKRKLTEEVRKLEIRFRERDTKFTDKLVAERTRLLALNQTLTAKLQQKEELQLDNDMRALKTSKAFNLEGTNKQEYLVQTLRKHLSLLQRRLNEKSASVEGSRERELNACMLRREMQTELWQQMDMVRRLTEQNEELRKQQPQQQQQPTLQQQTTPTVPAGSPLRKYQTSNQTDSSLSDCPCDPNAIAQPETLKHSAVKVTKPFTCVKPTPRIDLATLGSESKKEELPPDCKTS